MGFKVICLDPNPDSPCKSVAHEFITVAYDDEEALHELGEKSDVITYEFENISAEQLIRLTQNSIFLKVIKLFNYYKIV